MRADQHRKGVSRKRLDIGGTYFRRSSLRDYQRRQNIIRNIGLQRAGSHDPPTNAPLSRVLSTFYVVPKFDRSRVNRGLSRAASIHHRFSN